MKLNKDYITENYDKISNTFYGVCLFDTRLQNGPYIKNCFKSIFYKFSNDKELITEFQKIDIDKSIIYEEIKIPLTDEEYSNFKIIGRLPELIKYLENEYQ